MKSAWSALVGLYSHHSPLQCAVALTWLVSLVGVMLWYPLGKQGFILLLLSGVVLMVWRSGREEWRDLLVFCWPFAGLAVLTLLAEQWQPDYAQSEGKLAVQLRFLFIIPLFMLLRRYPLSAEQFWSGVVVSAWLCGLAASIEVLRLNGVSPQVIDRAEGGSYAIMFGDMAVLLAALSLLAAVRLPAGSLLRWSAFAAVLLALLASLLSGTRGGWLIIPLLPFAWLYAQGRSVAPRTLALLVGVVTVTLALLLSSSDFLAARIAIMVDEFNLYLSGEWVRGSVTLRLEMWKSAMMLFIEQPLSGWGLAAYAPETLRLANDGLIQPVVADFLEPHNDLLSILVSRGIPGGLLLIAIYLVPALHFKRALAEGGEVRNMALAGLLTVAAFIIFGLTETVFSVKAFIVLYLFLLVTEYTTITWLRRTHGEQNP